MRNEHPGLPYAALVLVVCAAELVVLLTGPYGMPRHRTASDYLFFALVVVHAAWGIRGLLRTTRGRDEFPQRMVAEILFSATLVAFLFSYIYALNANMDYVQRYALGKGYLRIAPDSTVERLNSLLRFAPLLIADGVCAAVAARRAGPATTRAAVAARRAGPATTRTADLVSKLALPAALLSAILYGVSFPSFIRLNGCAPAAYIALVPLLVVFAFVNGPRRVFYGTLFGVVGTMMTNYWLGTYSLVSLQFVTIVYLFLYAAFMVVVASIYSRFKTGAFVLVPVVWVVFDYLRSAGFIGYPWGMLGTTQYAFVPLIQISALTGVWGVTFVVVGVNAAVAFAVCRYRHAALVLRIGLFSAGAFSVLVGAGVLAVRRLSAEKPTGTVRVALVQQNTDPRKDDYAAGLEVLTELTDRVLPEGPDLVAWSETAFVPNIRRWSAYPRTTNRLTAVVWDFLDYQAQMGTWLVTGNDDYTLVETGSGVADRGAGDRGDVGETGSRGGGASSGADVAGAGGGASGQIERLDYNAAVFFAPDGTRVNTYHKIRLVPFTEYFPWKTQLPLFYEMLKRFDVYLWEPGTEYVVFDHPKFSFSTPICFEDSFPNGVRRFVREGADVILNLSNDYWSLTEVEAKQHYANAVFRAVENRRPLLRATASGVTCSVDRIGRLQAALPYYMEDVLLADVDLHQDRRTVYGRYGDWFPAALGVIAAAATVVGLLRRRQRRRQRRGNGRPGREEPGRTDKG